MSSFETGRTVARPLDAVVIGGGPATPFGEKGTSARIFIRKAGYKFGRIKI